METNKKAGPVGPALIQHNAVKGSVFLAAHVFTGAGIDRDDFTGTNEGRHVDLEARFQRGWFVLGRRRGAFKRWFGFDDLKVYGGGKFKADRLAFVQHDRAVVVFLEIQDGVAYPIFVEIVGIERFHIAENKVIAFLVQVLHGAIVEIGLLDLVFWLETVDGHRASVQVLHFEGQDGAPVAWRVQIAIHHGVELLVLANDNHSLAHFAVFNRHNPASRRFDELEPGQHENRIGYPGLVGKT